MEYLHAMVIKTPMVPTFLTADVFGEKIQVDVRMIPEEQLRKIGEEWTQKLIEHSKRAVPRTNP